MINKGVFGTADFVRIFLGSNNNNNNNELQKSKGSNDNNNGAATLSSFMF